jgi:hypothetical protein
MLIGDADIHPFLRANHQGEKMTSKYLRTFTGLSAGLLIGACRGSSGDLTTGIIGNGPIPVISIVSGGAQTARLDSLLPAPLVVRLDSAGTPVASALIVFTITYDVSPGPNWTWTENTGADGIARTNINMSPGPEGGPKTHITGSWTIRAVHRRCVDYVVAFECRDGSSIATRGTTIP